MEQTKIVKSVIERKKELMLLEVLYAQKRFFERAMQDDFPLYEKIKMVDIIKNNIIDHFKMKLSLADPKVNEIAERFVKKLFREIAEYINDCMLEYLDTYDSTGEYIKHYKSIRKRHYLVDVRPYDKDSNQIAIFSDKPINRVSPEELSLYDIPLTSYERYLWIDAPYIIFHTEKLLDVLSEIESVNNIPIIKFDSIKSLQYKIDLNQIKTKDMIIRTPYESYDNVLRFMDLCFDHKDLNMYFLTIYRVANPSKIMNMIKLYAERYEDKKFIIYIEPDARGDIEQNAKLASEFAYLSSNIVILNNNPNKIHAKMFLAISNSSREMYGHFSTGNYNEKTAGMYTDMHLITADPNKIIPSVMIFVRKIMYMTPGTAEKLTSSYNLDNKLGMQKSVFFSPNCLKRAIIGLIRTEIRKGKDGKIILKVNSLADIEIIEHLNEAVGVGVNVRLIVRSICLMDAIPDNALSIESFCGRFLEHDRIFVFGDRVFIGSADLSFRNLHKRIEYIIEVDDPNNKSKVIGILDNLKEEHKYYFIKDIESWVMKSK